jgi:CubicO group peptidase (beta-lactamase class C family)
VRQEIFLPLAMLDSWIGTSIEEFERYGNRMGLIQRLEKGEPSSHRYGADTVPNGYRQYSSPRTFGHGGSQSSVAFADPDRKLVVAVVFNGMPGEARHDARMRAFLAALYKDLGLV